jgi:hypothetical protein
VGLHHLLLAGLPAHLLKNLVCVTGNECDKKGDLTQRTLLNATHSVNGASFVTSSDGPVEARQPRPNGLSNDRVFWQLKLMQDRVGKDLTVHLIVESVLDLPSIRFR